MTATAVRATNRLVSAPSGSIELPRRRRPAARRAAPPTRRQRGRRPAAVAPPARVTVVEPQLRPTGGRAPADRVRLTRRGRLATTVLTLAILVAVFSVGRDSATPAVAAPPTTYDTISVAPGDSLWSIARERRPDADPRATVDQLIQLNRLRAGPLEAGRLLRVPTRQSR